MSDEKADPMTALKNARLYYAASMINTLSYGIYVVLALMGIQLLLQRKLQQKISLIYSIIMFCLTTAWFICNTKTNEILLVEETYNEAYKFSLYCSSTNVAAVALSSIQFMGSDLLLLYRTYVLWGRSLLAVSLPLMTWLAYIGIAITGNLSCTPLVKDIQGFTQIVTAYYSLSVATNVLCTILIVGKLVAHQRELRAAGLGMGNRNNNNKNLDSINRMNFSPDRDYRFMTAVIAESGFFYAVAGIANVVLTTKGHPLSNISNAVFAAMAYITQAQIILRVALGVEARTGTGRSSSGEQGSGMVSTAMAFGDRYGGQSTHATGHTGTTAAMGGSEVWTEKSRDEEAQPAGGSAAVADKA